MSEDKIKLVECPRDAMQGLHEFIPTKDKIRYINALLKVGFHTLDFGSFVSPTAIPQMRDTAEVITKIETIAGGTELLAIIANTRGAQEAVQFTQIAYLGFPLSLSETFQKKNTNKSIQEAFHAVEEIQDLCQVSQKKLVVYLSMGFGNPYGDAYDATYLQDFVGKLDEIKVNIICPSDTIGISQPENIAYLFNTLIPAFPHIEFGAHLHATPASSKEKIKAAWSAGCRRFDGAIRGFGGCPMATDTLVGNIPTEQTIDLFDELKLPTGINPQKFREAYNLAGSIFPSN